MNVGVLVSGELGYKVLAAVWEIIQPCFIATDRKSASIITFVQERDRPLFVGNPRNGRLVGFLEKVPVDVIFSINYLFLVERDVLSQVRHIINLHGSLLPKYRGRTPHVWAIINNESATGITAHLIDEGCDTGPIVAQKNLIIGFEETGADLLKKYERVYPEIIQEVFRKLQTGKLSIRAQDESRATYFGKRTPDDGLIDWTWQKERIYNWVRAQAFPYPGAFTLIGGNKVVIDRVSFHDGSFSQEEPNGLVKAVSPFLVKTPNGLVRLNDIREGAEHVRLNETLGK